MGGVFRPRQDAESENPGALQAAGFGRVGETFFFGSVSFGPAKEMNPLAARRVEAFDLARRRRRRSEQQRQPLSSADAAEFISFG